MSSSDRFDLNRFVLAQNVNNTYARALGEIKAGKKKTHWMWFIFPQLKGLSNSVRGKHYRISSLEEACAYLEHPLLRSRLVEIMHAVMDSETATARGLMGTPDDNKLQAVRTPKLYRSFVPSTFCVTLFLNADPVEQVFPWIKVLGKYYRGNLDGHSDKILERRRAGEKGDGTEVTPTESATTRQDIQGKGENKKEVDTEIANNNREETGKKDYALGG